MKRDLIIIGVVLLIATFAMGGVFWWQMTTPEDVKPVRPKTEPVALLPKKEEPKLAPPIEIITKKPARIEKKPAPEKKIEVKKTEPTKEDPVAEKKKEIEPKLEIKAEPKKVEPQATKLIVLDNLTKINDPQGEFVQPTINGGKTIVLLGVVKTLKIAGLNERSTLDATRLEAQEIVFTGHINGGSKAILGKGQRLTVHDVNDRSTLDAPELGAKVIHMDGGINGNSTIKLHAPGGVVEFRGELNDHAQVDVAAANGKVVFKGRNDASINGGAKINVVAKELEILGAVNGPQTSLDVTFTANGALKFRRINGNVRLHYRKADASEPDVRIEMGALDARADFRQMTGRK
jgi:hypothetical protein